MKKIIVFLIFIAAILIAVFFFVVKISEKKADINNFYACLEAGYPIMESYPRQCRAGDQTFVEDIGNKLEKVDLIRTDFPKPNDIVSSPINIRGEARGYWFFEATFPVKLLDENGNIVAQYYAQAKDEWMTENFVPFSCDLEFSFSGERRGELILEKDNPSGLSEYNDYLRIPVTIKGQ
jgi:hypothetical protein